MLVKIRKVFVYLALAAVAIQASAMVRPDDPDAINPAEPSSTGSSVTWSTVLPLEEIFPSFVLTTSTFKPPTAPSPHYLGEPFGMIVFNVRTSAPNTKIHGFIQIDQLAQRSEFSYELPEAGQYRVSPKVNYNFQRLAAILQPMTVNVSLSLSEEGRPAEPKAMSVRVRSVNDAVLSYKAADGRTINEEWSLAGFVNENHPAIDTILREALNLPVPIVRNFVGYQHGPDEVKNQVFAIWYLFQRQGFTYSSITTPTGISSKAQSQYVRFIGDSLHTQQANCLDGTVLFASILRRIGISPMIVLIPGHAFLGFFLDTQHRQVAFLETTAMNTPSNPYFNQRPSKFRDQMARVFHADFKLQKASESFDQALAIGSENYSKAQGPLRAHQPGFQILEIDKMRQIGIQPINR